MTPSVKEIIAKQQELAAAENAENEVTQTKPADATEPNGGDEVGERPVATAKVSSGNTYDDEVHRLQHELKSAQGRLKPTQQRLEAALADKANLEAALAEKQRRIDMLENELNGVQDLIIDKRVKERSERILERSPGIDLDHAEAMAYMLEEERIAQEKSRKAAMAQPAPSAAPAQEYGQPDEVKVKIKQILNDPRRNVGSLPQLVQDPEFVAWGENTRPIVAQLTDRLVKATSIADVESLAEQLDTEIELYYSGAHEVAHGTPSTPVAKNAGVADHMSRRRQSPISRAEYENRRRALMADVRSHNAAVRDEAQKKLDELHRLYHATR